MADLAALIARVEAAQGPDRALARDIASAALGVEWHPFSDVPGSMLRGDTADGKVMFFNDAECAEWLSSVDGALALKELCLPGWYWRAGWGSAGEWVNGRRMQGWCHLNRVHPDSCDREDEATGYAATVPLAIVLTTLKALQARAGQ